MRPELKIPLLRNRKVVIDTNVFILLVVGSIDPLLIAKNKFTHQWGNEDYLVLRKIIDGANIILVQPVLVESSDLLGNMDGFHEHLEVIIRLYKESLIPSKQLVKSIAYNEYGLADASILEQAKKGAYVVTADRRLSELMRRKKYNLVNFNEVIRYP